MKHARKTKRRPDRIDMRILVALAERGRQTITELAGRVGLSATPCSARVERLEAEGLISGYQAEVNVEKLADLSPYYVTIAAKDYSPAIARQLEALIAASPYIVGADCLFGEFDYILRVYARSTQHYHEIMAPFLELKIDYQTWPVSKRVIAPQLHRLVAELARTPG
jgi:DNA-binding Lrp family transcriptional regulator